MRFSRFSGADLTGAHMQGADASDCAAREVVLTQADATRSIWLNADLQCAKLHNTNFGQADLRGRR